MFCRFHQKTLARLIALCAASTVACAAQFQNLNFEAPDLPYLPIPNGLVLPATEAFPGWTAYVGSTPVSQAPYNRLPAGGAALVLIRPESSFIEGDYSALLIPGFDERIATLAGVSMAQTGLVPADARSILFSAAPIAQPSTLDVNVLLNGQEIPLITLQQNNGITLFGGDVSAFAGTTSELRFTVDYGDIPAHIDAISFSPLPVPEPSTWALMGVGLLCFASFVKRRARD